jgi:redox-sensitive bicupin YhaK (pirin superfamily)
MIRKRGARERGRGEHGWLDSWHSFSFADYRDDVHVHWGPLRVINEDRVQPAKGFPTHGHQDMEILSYVLEGELQHNDSMGNGSIIRPGDIQRMSAGRGVRHSEGNPSSVNGVHFLQIWIIPDCSGGAPEYEQQSLAPETLRGRLRLMVSGRQEPGALCIHQDVRLHAGRFDGPEAAQLALAPGRLGYVHVARGQLTVNGEPLQAGDALLLEAEPQVQLAGGAQAEVLVFDLPAQF